VDVDLLKKNLDDNQEATERAVEAFLSVFVKSMPSGKQNTFANRTLPDVIVISVRDDQSVSYVGAFEEPVGESANGGRTYRSTEKLSRYSEDLAEAYGSAPVRSWVTAVGATGDAATKLGERVSFDEAVEGAVAVVAQRLAGQS
jgi:CRISPR system Cascade subunit CasC